MSNSSFFKILESSPPELEEEVRISMDIALRIQDLMRQQKMTQSDLARKLNKSPAEINRWISGMHTFTTKTIAKLQCVFKKPIINIPLDKQEKYIIVIVNKEEYEPFEQHISDNKIKAEALHYSEDYKVLKTVNYSSHSMESIMESVCSS